jgi:hypothetical protein
VLWVCSPLPLLYVPSSCLYLPLSVHTSAIALGDPCTLKPFEIDHSTPRSDEVADVTVTTVR